MQRICAKEIKGGGNGISIYLEELVRGERGKVNIANCKRKRREMKEEEEGGRSIEGESGISYN